MKLDTVKSWSVGRNSAPTGAIAELRRLYVRIKAAADEHLYTIKSAPSASGIEIGYPADDREAQALGFPCVGAWRAMCAMVIAELDRPMRLVRPPK